MQREAQQAIVVADLGFGDAGKGSIIDALARRYQAHTVVRYNGGPQAAHNVVTSAGYHHTFAQFGSGSFVAGCHTLLSRFMLVNPLNLLKEARHLEELDIGDPLGLLLIDRRALVITPFQRALNRLRELARGDQRHGSCGEGIGECMLAALATGEDPFTPAGDDELVLRAGDLEDSACLRRKLHRQQEACAQPWQELASLLAANEDARRESHIFNDSACIADCLEVYAYFARQVALIDEAGVKARLELPGTLLFEGAQGVLLDENFGFAPYTTWSTTTFANAEQLAREHDYRGRLLRLGVVRAYATRHGAGPFPSEQTDLAPLLPEPHNGWNPWQRDFRVGPCDLVLARYAREVAGPLDALAITHADGLTRLPVWQFCTAYEYPGSSDELTGLCQHRDQHITALTAPCTPDLAHQERLTAMLLRCQPIYQVLPNPGEPTHYLRLLAEHYGTQSGIVSYGMTAEEKDFYPCCFR